MIVRCCDDWLSPPCLPASLWWTRPATSCPAQERVHSAISSASSGSSVDIEAAVRQPTMRRLKAPETKAVNAIPDQVGT